MPIFNERKITLQSVRTCQQVFSAALLGYVEANYKDDAKKNELCKPVPHPNTDIDFLRNNLADAINQDLDRDVLNAFKSELPFWAFYRRATPRT